MSIDSYFCLCCLSSDDLTSFQDANPKKNYEKMMQYLFTFKPMNEENGIDSYICDDCIEQLENAYRFKIKVYDTLNILRKQGLIELHKIDGQLIIKKGSTFSNPNDVKNDEKDQKIQINEDKTEICNEKSSEFCQIDIKVDVKNEEMESIKSKSVVTAVITQPMVKVTYGPNLIDIVKTSDDICDKQSQEVVEKESQLETQKQIKLERDKVEEKVACEQDANITTDNDKNCQNYEITEDLTCKMCGVVLPNLYVYHTHMNSHMPLHICETCGKGFPDKIKLRRHSYSHQLGPFVCDICGSEFTNYNTYSAHRQRNHATQSQYGCPHCNERFKTFSRRARHLHAAHGIKHDYACKHCGKTFLVAGSLSTHIRYTHEKIKRFTCSLCDAAFFFRQDLAAHQGTAHDAAHAYGCTDCGKRYARKNALKVHMRTHTNEKPYGCALCDKHFTQKCALVAHLKVHDRNNYILPDKSDDMRNDYLKINCDNLKTYVKKNK